MWEGTEFRHSTHSKSHFTFTSQHEGNHSPDEQMWQMRWKHWTCADFLTSKQWISHLFSQVEDGTPNEASPQDEEPGLGIAWKLGSRVPPKGQVDGQVQVLSRQARSKRSRGSDHGITKRFDETRNQTFWEKKSLAYLRSSCEAAGFGGHFRLESGHGASCTWHLFESPCEAG